jgi:pimeloyl-ACP methyl ester carboxylesterase
MDALVIVDGGPELNHAAALALHEHLKGLAWRYRTIAEFAAILADRHPLAERDVLEDYAAAALRRAQDEGFELRADPALRTNLPLPDDASTWAALEHLACPKLIVRGAASSLLSRRAAERVCQRAPNCRLVSVARAGHSVPLDKPAALYDALRPFLAAVAP